MSKNLSLVPGVVIEPVAGELLVAVPGQTEVLRLTGLIAETLLDIQAGKTVDASAPTVSDLVTLGVVAAPGVSRRGVLTAGAIGAGAGVVALSMPGVAAAASVASAFDPDDPFNFNVGSGGTYVEPLMAWWDVTSNQVVYETGTTPSGTNYSPPSTIAHLKIVDLNPASTNDVRIANKATTPVTVKSLHEVVGLSGVVTSAQIADKIKTNLRFFRRPETGETAASTGFYQVNYEWDSANGVFKAGVIQGPDDNPIISIVQDDILTDRWVFKFDFSGGNPKRQAILASLQENALVDPLPSGFSTTADGQEMWIVVFTLDGLDKPVVPVYKTDGARIS